MSITIATILSLSSCNQNKEINKTIFRGTYDHLSMNKRYPGDTMVVVNDRKEIDTLIKYFKSAKLLKNVNPMNPMDHEDFFYEIRFYADKNEKLKLIIQMEDDYKPYFKREHKYFEAKKLNAFFVKRYRELIEK